MKHLGRSSKIQLNKSYLFMVALLMIALGLLASPAGANSVTPSQSLSQTVSLMPFQQASDMTVKFSGPAYTNPGKTLTYTVTLKNVAKQEITNIKIVNPLPANTTYVSGGSYDDATKKVTLSIDKLAVGATETASFVVQLADSVAIDAVITLTGITLEYKLGDDTFTLSDYTVNTKVEQAGELLAIYKNANGRPFTLGQDDYKFGNFGNDAPRNWEDDLSAKDLFQMFGPQVCQQSGATANNCTLTAPAEKWRMAELKGVGGGHCEGMATTALQFFEGQSFNGKTLPKDFQANATLVADLNFPDQSIENYVTYYAVIQSMKEVYEKQLMDNKPSELVTILTDNFNAAKPIPYRMSIFNSPDYKDGHAITVYGVEKVSNTIYRILVYDNNDPKDRKYITVDTAKDSWEYFTAADPSKPGSVYRGDANTKTLWLSNLYDRQLEAGKYFTCKFCAESAASNRLAALQAQTDTVEISFSGEGSILVVDNDNRAIGYDFNQNKEVNEIPEAKVIYNNGGLGKKIPPIYEIPYPASDENSMYAVYVSNEVVTSTTDGMLSMTGDGFVVGLDYLQLDPNEYYQIGLSPDGDVLTVSASQQTDAPAMFISYEPISNTEPSLIFELDGAMLDPNEVLTITLDSQNKRVYFDDSLDIGNEFTVILTEIYPTGKTASYTQTITLPVGSKEAYADFGKWDGTGAAPVYIDGVLLSSSRKVYLPIVRK